MIVDIKELPRSDIELLKVRSVRCYLNYNKSKHYESIVKKLILEYGNKYNNVIRCLCTNTARMYKSNTNSLAITLHKGHYSNNIQGIGYTKMKDLITKLEEEGYIDIYKGFSKGVINNNKFEVDISLSTVLIFKKKFNDLWTNKNYKYVNLIDFDLVEIRDRLTKEPKSTRGVQGMKDKKAMLTEYNHKLINTQVSIDGLDIPSPLYKRVYTDSIDRGGRFYDITGIQTMKKELRPNIKIDGEKTVCLDYSALHPRLCYSLVGITVEDDFDPYGCDVSFLQVDTDKVESFKKEHNKPDYDPVRNLVKIAMLCALNAKGSNGNNSAGIAISAVSSKIGEDKKRWDHKDKCVSERSLFYGLHNNGHPIPVKELMISLLSHNKEIANFFYSDVGLDLQHQDSEMADYILGHFLQKDEVILGWHDGFIGRATLRDELEEVMYKAYYIAMGSLDNCKIKQEY
jgi:hypothetical protein